MEKRKCFEVKTTYDKAKNVAKDLEFDDKDWDFIFNTARFCYTKENFKKLLKILKSIFTDVKITNM